MWPTTTVFFQFARSSRPPFRQLKRGKDDNRIRNRANMPIAVSSATFADRSLTSVGKNALMPRPKS
jgi:hypothetical protein